MRPLDLEKARMRYAALCARSEQCSYDIRTKALRAGLSAADTRKLLDYLTENRFLDDVRFAGAFARDKAKFAGWGPVKIKAYLRLKQIPDALIAEALDSVPEPVFTQALEKAAAAKSARLDLNDYVDRQKLFRHLVSRGFTPGQIARHLSL